MKCSFLIITGLFSASICCAQTNKILETGNVGIGTTNPEAKLNIVGVEEDAGGNTFMIGTVNSSNLRMGVNTGYSWIQSHGGKPLSINELGNNVVINPFSGNLGVGTINPQAKLDVKSPLLKNEHGIVQPTVSIFSNDEPQIGVGGAISFGGKTGNANPEYAFAYLTGAKETTQVNNYAGYFAIRTVSEGENGEIMSANYERFRISANGNVGIGTSTPNSKLSVNGNIRAKEIKVETANWPDYVFAKDYKLPSLAETEKHIKEKGHLPGIPSAKYVEANGIDLGEMNAKLLQKIEELTLYLIKQQKENDKQEVSIELLKLSNEKLILEINKIKTKL